MINTSAMMTDRKKNRGKKFDEDEPPTKEEYAVAKFLRFNVPTREGKLHNMEVHCFFASAAVDALLASKWSASKNAKEPLFYNRSSCVYYCQRLMQKGMFHRVERVQRKKDKDKDKGDKAKKKKGREAPEKEDTGTGDELRERKAKKDKKGKKDKDDSAPADKTQTSEKEEGGEKKEEKVEEKKEEGKKKKEKRLKLIMTDDQRFLDGEENIYVWIYDPANAKTLVIGSLIVLGAIALCLFPLWPEVVRLGVYYLSLAAAGFVGFILALVVIRLILFCIIWLLTLGRHHFWLLPNLTEDVGFFDSFRPLYQHDTVTREPPSKDKDKGKSASSSSSSSSSSKSSKKADPESQKTKAKKKDKASDKEETGSEGEEFEVIERGEVEEGGGGGGGEGEEDQGTTVGTEDKDIKGPEEEEEDYEEEEEEEQNGGSEEQEEEEEEDEEDSLMKKDK
ncbi:translocation protein SEC62-like [Babylonia areolata]|uniref:translocation protein SEC62-like n=1 Tax=Babylonia areolata TaxID=304850 RepID=UPI003FCFAE81